MISAPSPGIEEQPRGKGAAFAALRCGACFNTRPHKNRMRSLSDPKRDIVRIKSGVPSAACNLQRAVSALEGDVERGRRSSHQYFRMAGKRHRHITRPVSDAELVRIFSRGLFGAGERTDSKI